MEGNLPDSKGSTDGNGVSNEIKGVEEVRDMNSSISSNDSITTLPQSLKDASLSPQISGQKKSPHRLTPSPRKDYKLLYQEVKRRLFEQAENAITRYQRLEEKHQSLEKKYREEVESRNLEPTQREIALATDNDLLKETLSRREAEIKTLKINIQSITKSRDVNRSDYETMISEHNKTVNEKDQVIDKLDQQLANTNIQKCSGLKRVDSEDECYRLKPKRSSKNTKSNLKCEFEDCNETDVDLVKCNLCSKWVCESCNDVPVTKLKPITNKCRTIYFLCKKCDESVGTVHCDRTTTTNSGDANLLDSLQKMLDKKVSQLETKIEKSIDKKLGDKMGAVNSLNEKMTNHEKTATEEKKSYAKILDVPTEVRKIMQETRNDEKVEQIEQEKRGQNFIIHGAQEVGNSTEEIKANDLQYIKDILKHMNLKSEPESVVRLGKSSETKSRVLKIVMPTKEAKEEVMSNLRLLKDTVDTFGKISVTDDYTSIERQNIKNFSERAREQGRKDPSRVYKVRGDPKNGLRIIAFKKE